MVCKAASFYGVPPWDLYSQPVIWSTWALEIIGSEGWAENEFKRHHRDRQESLMSSGLPPEVIEQFNR
jgi:hypothetical protein